MVAGYGSTMDKNRITVYIAGKSYGRWSIGDG